MTFAKWFFAVDNALLNVVIADVEEYSEIKPVSSYWFIRLLSVVRSPGDVVLVELEVVYMFIVIVRVPFNLTHKVLGL